MVERHFAFFQQGSGEYVREWKGPVPEPDLHPALCGEAREAALNAWATAVSQPQPSEIGLDVTQFGYPVGDFCWMRFDEIDRVLDWPASHKFIQIDKATMTIDVNCASPRPIRSTPERRVIDITGTWLEPFHGAIFGRFAPSDGRIVFLPSPGCRLPEAIVQSLTDRHPDLALVTGRDRTALQEATR